MHVRRCLSALRPSNSRFIHLTAEQNAEQLAIDDDEAPRRLLQSFELERIDKNIYRFFFSKLLSLLPISSMSLQRTSENDQTSPQVRPTRSRPRRSGFRLRRPSDRTVSQSRSGHCRPREETSLYALLLSEEWSVPHTLIRESSLSPGSVLSPILYLVDPVREGRSFCTRIVKAVQDGENLFTAQISFHVSTHLR